MNTLKKYFHATTPLRLVCVCALKSATSNNQLSDRNISGMYLAEVAADLSDEEAAAVALTIFKKQIKITQEDDFSLSVFCDDQLTKPCPNYMFNPEHGGDVWKVN